MIKEANNERGRRRDLFEFGVGIGEGRYIESLSFSDMYI